MKQIEVLSLYDWLLESLEPVLLPTAHQYIGLYDKQISLLLAHPSIILFNFLFPLAELNVVLVSLHSF